MHEREYSSSFFPVPTFHDIRCIVVIFAGLGLVRDVDEFSWMNFLIIKKNRISVITDKGINSEDVGNQIQKCIEID